MSLSREPGRTAQTSTSRWGVAEAACLVLPLLRLFQFDGIGRLYGTDFAILAAVALLLPGRSQILKTRYVRMFLIACAIYLLGAVATDIYRASAFQDWTRGWSKIILFAVSFLGLTLLFDGKLNRAILYLVGTTLAQLLESLIFPGDFVIEEPWKFGFGPGITLLAILIAESQFFTSRFGRTIGVVFVFATACLSFSLNARSLFGLAAAAAAIGFAKLIFDPARKGLRITPHLFAGFVLLSAVLTYGVTEFQNWAALSGALGYEAEQKALSQSTGDLGVILGGRVESLVSTQAIMDSPILGHGSWARNIDYVALLADMLTVKGIRVVESAMLEDDLIPSHSHLLGAWVENGILGGLFWVWLLFICLKSLKAVIAVPFPRPMLLAFLAIGLMWDIAFSPFGADRRFVVPTYTILMFTVIELERRRSARLGSPRPSPTRADGNGPLAALPRPRPLG